MTSIERDFREILDILWSLVKDEELPEKREIESLYLRLKSYYQILLPLFKAMRGNS